jgi:hypothetical protein
MKLIAGTLADVQLGFDQFDDLLPAISPWFPRRLAPAANRRIPLRSWINREHIRDSDRAPLLRHHRPNPLFAALCQLHVGKLHPPAGEVLFDVQIQAHQREHNRNRL